MRLLKKRNTRYLRFFGTLAPELRASESPIAIACLRLVTFLPERPDLSLPRFISCIVFLTFRWEAAPNFRLDFLRPAVFLRPVEVVAINDRPPQAAGSLGSWYPLAGAILK